MKMKQHGFTLLELMIVIAILGILAAIAVPAYQDYTVRTKVAEGLQLATAAKLAVSETYQSSGTMPTSNSAAGLAEPISIAGKYVSSIQIGNAGQITITYSAPVEIAGKTITLIPSTVSAGSIRWTCASTLPEKYIPAQCR